MARDPKTEKAAVVNFPVLKENPYRIDVAATRELIAKYEPELIILGKSMTLHPEPVAAVRQFVDDLNLDCIIMNDMAHVLGLVGRHFQRPFQEGADVVTGSTHKTFYGTQRGNHRGRLLQATPSLSVLGGHRAARLPGCRQQPPSGDTCWPVDGVL